MTSLQGPFSHFFHSTTFGSFMDVLSTSVFGIPHENESCKFSNDCQIANRQVDNTAKALRAYNLIGPIAHRLKCPTPPVL